MKWSVAALSLGLICSAASAQTQSSALKVNGQDGEAPVIYRNGRSYVDIESLARLTGATLGFQGSRIILTLPSTAVASPSAPSTPPKQEDPGYTQDFLRAAVEHMTVIREWRSAIENAVRTNNPVEPRWISGYRQNAETGMQLATASATSSTDRQGLGLLQGAMGMMQQMSDHFLSLRATVTFVPTDALDNDQVDQKILSCAQGMASQAIPGGKFEDVPSCH